MLFNKVGLAGGRSDIDPEVTISEFKAYDYSIKDFKRVYTSYDSLRVQINVPFKILNGTLTIKEKEYNLGDKTLKDVHDIFNQYGTASFFTGYEVFSELPAILLSDCSNVFIDELDGHMSPTKLEEINHNNTITSLDIVSTNILVYDNESGNSKHYVKKYNKLFFSPTPTTKIFVTSLTKDLYLRVDFGPRRLISEKDVSYLLNFKRENT